MYFLEQLKIQLNLTLRSYDSLAEGVAGWNSVDPTEQQTAQAQDGTEMQGPPTAETLAFQELNEELDAIDNDSTLVNTYVNILGKFLMKVRRWEIEGLSEDDTDFQRLLNLYKNKFEDLKDMRNRGQSIEHIITQSMGTLNEAVDKWAEGGDIDDALDVAYEQEIAEREKREELWKLEIQRDSYAGILREKIRELPSFIDLTDIREQFQKPIEEIISEELVDSDGKDLSVEDKISKLSENNATVLERIWEFDKYVQDNNPETIYTTIMIESMRWDANTKIAGIREVFFTKILWENISSTSLVSFKDHENIKRLLQETEGFEYGYDIIPLLEQFDAINMESFSEITDDNKQALWVDIAVALWEINEIERNFWIIERDIQVIDWEKTFWEVRMESTHEYFNSLTLNENWELTGLWNKLSDSLDRLPEFEDLNSAHIKIMMDAGVDMRKLFITSTDTWESWGKDSFTAWDSFVINFWVNKELASEFDFSYLDVTASVIELDGKQLRFREKWEAVEAGYYDENNNRYPLQDGSLITIIELREDQSSEEITRIQEQVGERLGYQATQDANYGAFIEAAYGNPDEDFLGITFPKWIAWVILGNLIAMLQSFQLGIKLRYDPETRKIVRVTEDESNWSAFTNREVVGGYVWSMELWSLSSEYESGSNWPFAYNPDDNGAGPSYGSYQMNTDKWCYRDFARKHNIAPWYDWWKAKIEEVWWPEKFHELEHQYIKETHFDVMMWKVTIPWKENFTLALQNVVWSSAVQHGPNKTAIINAINNSWVTPWDIQSESDLINKIYDTRWSLWPAWVASRYNQERVRALQMLNSISIGWIISEWNIYDQNIWEIPDWFVSRSAETSSSWTTLCSKTARLNLSRLWVQNVHQGSSAKDSFRMYPSDVIQPFPPTNSTDAKVADFYLDASSGNAEYGHRVSAFEQWGKWYVLDPYYNVMWVTWSARNNPIPAERYIEYMKAKSPPREFWWAAYFK